MTALMKPNLEEEIQRMNMRIIELEKLIPSAEKKLLILSPKTDLYYTTQSKLEELRLEYQERTGRDYS